MTFRPLAFSLLAMLGLAAALPVHAATLTSGDLIKTASHPDVYYYGPDAKRYVFPNEKTFFTWYSAFSTRVVTDAELAAVQIGGAVTYRPGLRMVKVTTDPKVYAVAKNGTLRWIETESLATSLYGSQWAMMVNDIPDALFTTYRVGAPIASSNDYSPNAELLAAASIAADRGLIPTAPTTTTPTPPTNGSLALTTSKTDAKPGDTVTLTATAAHPLGVSRIDLFFDNVLIKSCNAVTSCAGDAQIPISGTKSSYGTKAVAIIADGSMLSQSTTVTVTDGSSPLAKITITRPIVRHEQAGEVIIDADPAIAVIRTDIYMNGESIKACASGILQCRWSDLVHAAVGFTYDFYGMIADNIGRTYKTPHKTITVSTNDSPIVHVLPAKNLIYAGETLDVTVSASDDDGIQNIDILKDGTVIKSCVGAVPCTITTGPWLTPGTLTFNGRATDGLGLIVTNGDVSVTVQ